MMMIIDRLSIYWSEDATSGLEDVGVDACANYDLVQLV